MGRSIVREKRPFPPLEGDKGGGQGIKIRYNHYNPYLKEFARQLRNQGVSKAEKLLWKSILRKAQLGVNFKRQRPINQFIVDFFCQEIGLIIEIDGSSHVTKEKYDRQREEILKDLGFTIVRFSEVEVLTEIESVRTKLIHVIDCLKEFPPPSPLQRGKR